MKERAFFNLKKKITSSELKWPKPELSVSLQMSLNTHGHLGHHHGNYHVQVDSCGKTSSKNKVVQHTPVYISLGTHTSTYCDSTIMMQNACIVINFFCYNTHYMKK